MEDQKQNAPQARPAEELLGANARAPIDAPRTESVGFSPTGQAMPSHTMPTYADANSPGTQTVRTVEAARAAMPQYPDYVYADDDFCERYDAALSALDELYEKRGGIFIVDIEPMEANVIIRLPSREIMIENQKMQKEGRINADGADRLLLKQCLLYPNFKQIEDWLLRWPGCIGGILDYMMIEIKAKGGFSGKKFRKRRA